MAFAKKRTIVIDVVQLQQTLLKKAAAIYGVRNG